jgi:hypothetical protein
MGVNPLAKAVGQLVKNVWACRRAKARLADAIGTEEEHLRVNAQCIDSLFNRADGCLAITNRALRFEKARSMFNRPAQGSVTVPLISIRAVRTGSAGLVGGKIILETTEGDKTFAMGSRSKANEVGELVRSLCQLA